MNAGKRILVIILIAGLLLSIIGQLAENGFKSVNGHYFSTLEKVFKSDSSNNDALIIGNSIVKFGVNPFYIDSLTGLNSYNLGYPGTGFSTQAFFLKEYLQHHKPPAIVILGISNYSFCINKDQNNNIPLYNYLPDSDLISYFKNSGISYLRANTIPLYKFVILDDYTRFGILNSYRGGADFQSKGFYNYKGFYSYRNINKRMIFAPMADTAFLIVQKEAVLKFNEIVDICYSNHIKLVLVFHPGVRKNKKLIVTNQYKIDSILNAFKENNLISVLNRSDSSKYKDEHFIDGTHLTYTGSIKFSIEIGNFVKNSIQ